MCLVAPSPLGLPPNPQHDGKSFLSLLTAGNGAGAEISSSASVSPAVATKSSWRTTLIIEYLSVGTYYNDHAKIWLAGPWGNGSLVEYGNGPATTDLTFNESGCPATEGMYGVGKGVCHFVDSKASNNWIALRVRNTTHNFVYAESFGSKAMAAPAPWDSGAGNGTGIYKCLPGDDCQWELYHYGPITSDYPHFPVMEESRWNLHNVYKDTPTAVTEALHAELKHAYCSTRRLSENRMEC